MQVDSPASGRLVVDLDALAHNYGRLRETVAPSECGAVVKANAYGLGVEPVARRLFREGCRSFFVATLDEGIQLRNILPSPRIFVFEGAVPGSTAGLAGASLMPVLNSLEQIARWAEVGGPAVLHVDTGMARLGLSAADVDTLASQPTRLRGTDIEYVMTHLACADDAGHALNQDQLAAFDSLRARLPDAKTSIGNSAGAFLGTAHCGDLVRPGIALYGGNPFVDRPNPMEAMVCLRAKILQIRSVEAATTVGYGATYAVAAATRLAVVGIGYADGYPRCLGNVGAASVGGMRVPVVGRVSMDLLCLDVSSLPTESTREGDYVELIGGDISLDEVAEAAGTISYEILTGLGIRLEREYRGDLAEG
jgi:alanine racemase